jgi:lysophospholipase L1-like esterase
MRAQVRLPLAVALLSGSISVVLFAQQEAPRKIEPERFAEQFEEFAAEDKASPPPEGAIVVTGSSSVRRWHPTIKEDLAPLTIIPRGFGGSTMEDALYWIDKAAIQYKPRAVVVYEGDNDTGSYRVPAAKIAEQFEAIVAKVHAALPETRVYVISVKPSVSRWATWPEAVKTNDLLKAIAEKNNLVTYIDVATPMLQPNGEVMTDIFVDDNLHLNPKGYEIWSAAIEEPLMQGEAQYEKAAAGVSTP